MRRGQTIQIYLPSGNPQGLRQAEITTRTVQVFDVPRSALPEFLVMDQSHQVSLYFLFGPQDPGGDDLACYVGESDDVGTRLRTHDRSKEFWSRALVAVSLTNAWTKAHVRYLEARAVKAAREAGRYTLLNGNEGFTSAHTPLPLQADCDEFFDTISTLTATLGHPVLRPVKSRHVTRADRMLHLRSRPDTTSATFSAEGLTVFAGTLCDDPRPRGRRYPSIDARRQSLVDEGILGHDGTHLCFLRDWVFSTPSGAASVILGRSSNGWDAWRDSSGRTLDQMERNAAETGDLSED